MEKMGGERLRRPARDVGEVDASASRASRSRRLVVGAVYDAPEQRADALAGEAVARLGMDGTFGATSWTTSRIRRATLPAAGADGSRVGSEGGEVDRKTHERIESARSGGRGLPPAMRRKFEDALGASLGSVRVHAGETADELNDRLGAAAFTTGSDVFFRGGLPDVSSASGAGLLAHELAHVVQQRSGAPVGRIRRKVGFEFESSTWTLERLMPHKTSLTWRETSGRDPIAKSDIAPVDTTNAVKTWGKLKLTGDRSSDGSTHIEWVIDPPVVESDAGRAELARIMDQLRAMNDALIGDRDNAKIKRLKTNLSPPTDFVTRYRASNAGFGLPKTLLVEPWGSMSAEPQMTAGIRLSQLYKVMERMSDAQKVGESDAEFSARNQGTTALMGKSATSEIPMVSGGPAAVRAAFAAVQHQGNNPPAAASERLISLVALMRTYVLRGAEDNVYAKGIAPFLAKTDFAKLYSMLPEATYYHDNEAEWLELVLTACGLQMTAGATPLFSATFQYVHAAGGTAALRKLTKRGWIVRLARDGVDMCTQAYAQTSNDLSSVEQHLFGFGARGNKTDRVGPAQYRTSDSAILEFRRMMSSLPHDRWKEYALELFDYVRGVNAYQRDTYSAQGYFG